ncbi:branched-chain amino acid transport system permease protein [Meinhardsimonia xiamenensis]|jgi:branched-chain amino acid transport system permease protein|uniref:Branched-chain amino acid transport system permease protein n=1 Tax=Meinhardsimonia xiamenensis TaxID=990712 RepID=A0A1G9AXM8_9RHOB|nr:branched-chain amino acid ABC transporter permease [Meinhardsimonia xiamenensis]PRX35210.1 branched-chain amino acid transport system permease protein [Meinhardsimonia xiamenensis]SDK31983.1 branched-chain amino acid transport system permease protein [Meinhardsimonia xiamenensis]
MDILITGLLLGGTYALIAMGLNLQYGMARIMNLANGEMLVAGGFAAFWLYNAGQVSPLLTVFLVAPLAFALNWLIYRVMLLPLVRRAKSRGQLEVDSILATFGLSFVAVGLMLMAFGGDYFSYSYLARPVSFLGDTYALNRMVAFLAAVVICGALYLWLERSRAGMSIRAIAVAPESARLVGIDVPRLAAIAFALGGAVTAAGGALISSFLTLDASTGVVFTLKALIIVIMGGVGDVRGTIVAALLLGVMETFVAALIDPGLTLAAAYLLFILILLFRPQGLFGQRTT